MHITSVQKVHLVRVCVCVGVCVCMCVCVCVGVGVRASRRIPWIFWLLHITLMHRSMQYARTSIFSTSQSWQWTKCISSMKLHVLMHLTLHHSRTTSSLVWARCTNVVDLESFLTQNQFSMSSCRFSIAAFPRLHACHYFIAEDFWTWYMTTYNEVFDSYRMSSAALRMPF